MASVLFTGREGAITSALRKAGYRVEVHRVIRHEAIRGSLDAVERWIEAATNVSERRKRPISIVITSMTTAHFLQPLIENLGEKIHEINFYVSGPSTASACEKIGCPVSVVADQPAGAESLLHSLAKLDESEDILCVGSSLAGNRIPEVLRQSGHTVNRLDIYSTHNDLDQLAQLEEIWDDFDAVVITSPSSAQALSSIVTLSDHPGLVAIGERTSQTLSEDYEADHVVAEATTPAAIVEAVKEALS